MNFITCERRDIGRNLIISTPMPPKQPQLVIEHGMFFYENGDVYIGDYVKEGETTHRHGKGAYICYSDETRAIPQVPEELKTLVEPVR